MGIKNFVFKVYPLNKDLSARWCVDFYYEGTHGVTTRGKRFISKKCLTLLEKEAEAAKIIEAIKAGYKPKKIEAVENANTHIQRLHAVLEEKQVKEKSKISYRGHVKALNRYCVDLKIKTVTEAVANDFLTDLRKTHEGRTVNHHSRTLKELFSVLKKNKEIKKNPFESAERFKTKKAFSEHWNDADVQTITGHVKKHYPQLFLPIMTILHCATRNGREMPNIRIKDIDFEQFALWIDDEFSKNGEREMVKIPNSLMKIFREAQLDTYDKELYLFSKLGYPHTEGVGKNYLNRIFKKVLKELGINKKGKGFYRLKNSLAVKLVKNKVNTFAIKTQFRHKSFKTTEEYLKSLNVSDFPELENFSFF